MGKTQPTYRNMLEQLEQEWRPMRRFLRRRHQPLFDQLWTHAQERADVAGHANRRDPMEAVLMSICLEQQREIAQLQERVELLEEAAV